MENERDPMQESLEILQDIATEIANLRESQARNTLSPRLQIATAILAGWAANASIDETSIPFSIGSALQCADDFLSDSGRNAKEGQPSGAVPATREEIQVAIQQARVNAATIAGLVQRVERLEVQQ